MANKPYSIFDLGLDNAMNRPSSLLAFNPPETTEAVGAIAMVIPNNVRAENVTAGELPQITFVAKQSFIDTVAGMRAGVDIDGEYKWIIGGTTGSVDWNVTTANTLTVTGAIAADSGTIGGFEIGATSLSVTSGGNTTIVSSGATAFTAGPTGSPTFTVTQAGAITSTLGTIAAFTIAATTLSATNLTITSGAANVANISVGTGSNLSGLNAGNSGTDIAGWAGTSYANRATAPFRWNLQGDVVMESATISGVPVTTIGTFGGDGSDGALTITSGTTTVDLGGADLVVLNYTSVSITGSGQLAFSNPAATGTKVIIKSQGNVTLTSSASPNIDGRQLGAEGGAGGAIAAGTGDAGTNVNADFILDSSDDHFGSGATATATGGVAGSIYGNKFLYPSTANRIIRKFIEATPGSGGGGGAGANAGTTGTGGAGGRGGGSIIIECGGAYNCTKVITVAGQNGTAGGNGTTTGGGGGGGGGGAGGCIIVLYATLTADSGTYTVTGGNGGNGGNAADATGSGGGGGGGAGDFSAVGGAGGNQNTAGTGSTTSTGGNAGGSAFAPDGGGGGGGADGFSLVIQNKVFA